MVAYSDFTSQETVGAAISKDYCVRMGGKEIPVYTCRISAYPFNTWWPGHQRPIEQSEEVSFVNLVADETVTLEVEPLTKTAYRRVMLKPYAKGIRPEKRGNRLVFSLTEAGGYVLELDDYHGLLYIFLGKPIEAPEPSSVTYYFGRGVHEVGKLVLQSNESVYVDRDALVRGSIYAENAENIRIFGNGVLDGGWEERLHAACFGGSVNGNLQLRDCSDASIEGVGMLDSATWCISLFHCLRVTVDGARIFGQWRYNTDGIDIVNCQDVTVKNSFVHSFDDAVTIKGIDAYSDRSNVGILVENCALWCDWGRTMEIGLESECREDCNITFRRCDVLRGGSVACDIQNGDCAEVHHVTFEDISLELESFYTPEILQRSEEQVYDAQNVTAIATLLMVDNPRFRASYSFLDLPEGDRSRFGTPDYASSHDVTVRNVTVFCDDEILAAHGKSCVKVLVRNRFETTEYRDITVEHITLNGERVARSDAEILVEGCPDSTLRFF